MMTVTSLFSLCPEDALPGTLFGGFAFLHAPEWLFR